MGERGPNEKSNCNVRLRAAQGRVAKAKKVPSVPSLDEWDGHLAAGHAEYRGWCPFCVADKGKSEAHRRIEASRDHGHPELHLDHAFMGRETEDRASPILVGKFSKDCWLIKHLVPCKGSRHRWIHRKACERCDHDWCANPGGEVRSGGVERGVEGLTVMPEESPVGASAANAVIERSVWEMQSTTRALVLFRTLSGCMEHCLNQAVLF